MSRDSRSASTNMTRALDARALDHDGVLAGIEPAIGAEPFYRDSSAGDLDRVRRRQAGGSPPGDGTFAANAAAGARCLRGRRRVRLDAGQVRRQSRPLLAGRSAEVHRVSTSRPAPALAHTNQIVKPRRSSCDMPAPAK